MGQSLSYVISKFGISHTNEHEHLCTCGQPRLGEENTVGVESVEDSGHENVSKALVHQQGSVFVRVPGAETNKNVGPQPHANSTRVVHELWMCGL